MKFWVLSKSTTNLPRNSDRPTTFWIHHFMLNEMQTTHYRYTDGQRTEILATGFIFIQSSVTYFFPLAIYAYLRRPFLLCNLWCLSHRSPVLLLDVREKITRQKILHTIVGFHILSSQAFQLLLIGIASFNVLAISPVFIRHSALTDSFWFISRVE